MRFRVKIQDGQFREIEAHIVDLGQYDEAHAPTPSFARSWWLGQRAPRPEVDRHDPNFRLTSVLTAYSQLALAALMAKAGYPMPTSTERETTEHLARVLDKKRRKREWK